MKNDATFYAFSCLSNFCVVICSGSSFLFLLMHFLLVDILEFHGNDSYLTAFPFSRRILWNKRYRLTTKTVSSEEFRRTRWTKIDPLKGYSLSSFLFCSLTSAFKWTIVQCVFWFYNVNKKRQKTILQKFIYWRDGHCYREWNYMKIYLTKK